MTDETTPLLPCPFCGSTDIDLERDAEYVWEVQCLGACGALITHPRRRTAVAMWNRRSVA